MIYLLGPLLMRSCLSVTSLKTSKTQPLCMFSNFIKMGHRSSTDALVGKTIPDDVLNEPLLTEKNDHTSLRSILLALPESYKGIVVFLFPAVGTPYCTKQACRFSSSTSEFKRLGYEVFGLTRTPGGSVEDWTKTNRLNYTILLDRTWKLIKYLDCTWMHFLVNRSHVIIGRNAKILALERGVNAETSADRALELVKSLPLN